MLFQLYGLYTYRITQNKYRLVFMDSPKGIHIQFVFTTNLLFTKKKYENHYKRIFLLHLLLLIQIPTFIISIPLKEHK